MTMSRVFVVFFAFLLNYTLQGCSGGEPAATSAPATTAAATTADAPDPTVAAVSGPKPTEAPAPIIETPVETLVDTGYGYGYGYRMLADEMDNFVI